MAAYETPPPLPHTPPPPPPPHANLAACGADDFFIALGVDEQNCYDACSAQGEQFAEIDAVAWSRVNTKECVESTSRFFLGVGCTRCMQSPSISL